MAPALTAPGRRRSVVARQGGRGVMGEIRGRVAVFAVCSMVAGVPAIARATSPSITQTISGTLGSNGWYVSPVTVHWSVSGDPSSTSGCEPAVPIPGDTTGTTRTCTVSGLDGSTAAATTPVIRIDHTPPVASAVAPARAPDHDGWYTSPG